MKIINRNVLLLGVAVICFGSFEVVSKPIMTVIHPLQFTFIRFLLGGLFLLPFSLHHLRKNQIKLTRQDLLWLLFLGFLNAGVSMNLMQVALVDLPASLAALIFSTNPLAVAVLAAIILKEKFTVRKAVAFAVCVVGVALSLGNIFQVTTDNYLAGVILQIASTVIFALYTVLGKKMTTKIGGLAVTAIHSVFGSLTVLPILAFARIGPFDFAFREIWLSILYTSIVITGGAYFCYFMALKNLDTSLGSMTFFVKPLLSMLLAAAFLDERIRANFVCGLVLVMLGIALVVMPGKPKKQSVNCK